LAYLPRQAKQLLLLPHLALCCRMALKPAQRDSSLLHERKRRALVACTKASSKAQVCLHLVIQKHWNAQPGDIGRSAWQRWLKRRAAAHKHGLARLRNTRQQMLSRGTQFDVIRQNMRAKLRQYDDGLPAW
jgi:hypothetical protein